MENLCFLKRERATTMHILLFTPQSMQLDCRVTASRCILIFYSAAKDFYLIQLRYDLVVRHFLACCSEDGIGHETVVDIDIAGEKFTAKGLLPSCTRCRV